LNIWTSGSILTASGLNSIFTTEEYHNHLGATDNFMQTAYNGGLISGNITNHKMYLNSGLTSGSYGSFYSKKTWELGTRPIIVNGIIQDIVAGDGTNNNCIFGLASSFTSIGPLSIIIPDNFVGILINSGGSVTFYIMKGAPSAHSHGYSITVVNGDLITIVASASECHLYVNGILQESETDTAVIPIGALYLGAYAGAFYYERTVAGEICIDFISIKQ